MDPSTQYDQQQAPDQSQVQPYTDPSPQTYYGFPQFNQYLQPQYTYYPQDYTNAHQESYQESTSIHPPGVLITPESQTHVYNQHNPYYPHGVMDQQAPQKQQWKATTAGLSGQQWQGHSGAGYSAPIVQTPSSVGGRRGVRPYRGSGATCRGRGRGRGGRGRSFPSSSQSPVWPPPHMAWCELCRVDCNTVEILEQHKNGKKHKKKYEELQKLNGRLVGEQTKQIPAASQVNQGVSVSDDKVESEQQNALGEDRSKGVKRKMKGGRGGSKRQMQSPKPKAKQCVIPLVCELCNVKCDTQMVFQIHLAGKKHLSNLHQFHGQQAMMEQAALQALYPALQAILQQAAIQGICTPTHNAQTSFGIQFHGEGGGGHSLQGGFPKVGQLMFPPDQKSASALAQSQQSVPENGSSPEFEPKTVNLLPDNSVMGPPDNTGIGAEELGPSDHGVSETGNNV